MLFICLSIKLIAEQTIISKSEGEKGKLDAFSQIGLIPDKKINLFGFYLGAGFNYTGLLFKNASDVLGLAFAHSRMSSHIVDVTPSMLGAETSIELTYAFPLTDQISIQPDLQYIINPGVDKNIDNAFVGILRIVIEH